MNETITNKTLRTELDNSQNESGADDFESQLTDNYSLFRDEVEAIISQLQHGVPKKDLPQFLGQGGNTAAYRVDVDGSGYVARLSNNAGFNTSEAMASRKAALARGSGVVGLEQIVAYKPEADIAITQLMSGQEITNISQTDIEQINYEQLAKLIDTLATASDKGLMIDPKPSNIFYDAEAGFGIIDYSLKSDPSADVGKQVSWAAADLGWLGYKSADERYAKGRNLEEFQQLADRCQVNLEILKLFREVAVAKLPSSQIDTALARIDKEITDSQGIIENYRNPEWVENYIHPKPAESQEIEW
jgi:hypothetical protein